MKPTEPLQFDKTQQHFAEANRVARKMSREGTTKKRVRKWAEEMKAALKTRQG